MVNLLWLIPVIFGYFFIMGLVIEVLDITDGPTTRPREEHQYDGTFIAIGIFWPIVLPLAAAALIIFGIVAGPVWLGLRTPHIPGWMAKKHTEQLNSPPVKALPAQEETHE